jgi:hypothetical protein
VPQGTPQRGIGAATRLDAAIRALESGMGPAWKGTIVAVVTEFRKRHLKDFGQDSECDPLVVAWRGEIARLRRLLF